MSVTRIRSESPGSAAVVTASRPSSPPTDTGTQCFNAPPAASELVVVTGRQSAASSDFDPVVSGNRGAPGGCKGALEQTGAGVDFEEVHLFAVGPPFHANRQLVRSIGVEISIPVPQLQGQGRPGKKQQGLGFESAGGPGPAQPAVGLEDPQGAVVEQGVGQVERGRGDLAAFRGVERETHQGAVLRQRIAGGGQDDLEGVEIGAVRRYSPREPSRSSGR